MKRYIIEWGRGVDIHGGDVTKAAVRALKDAMSNSCLAGIEETLGIKDSSDIIIQVKIASPHHEKVDIEKIRENIPVGRIDSIDIVEGGMTVKGANVKEFGEGSEIVIVLAAITVCVNI